MRGVISMATRLPAWYAFDQGGKRPIMVGILVCEQVELRTCCAITVHWGEAPEHGRDS